MSEQHTELTKTDSELISNDCCGVQNEESSCETNRRKLVPRVHINESETEITLHAVMPGVTLENAEITLDKEILTITGKSFDPKMEGYQLRFSEYLTGDYERSFRIREKIQRDHIQANLKNGVLQITLKKVVEPEPAKVTISAG